jgi:hypothetical protein
MPTHRPAEPRTVDGRHHSGLVETNHPPGRNAAQTAGRSAPLRYASGIAPFTTMIILSVVLSLVIWLLRR